MKNILLSGLILALSITSASGESCGGNFDVFVRGLQVEALEKGYSRSEVDQFFASATQDPKTVKADRAQGVFQLPFVEFSGRLISKHRMQNGAKNLKKYKSVFDDVERRFGVQRGILTAFWAFETDFGVVQGNFNTLNSLVTLAHDCRRPDLFRPQVFAALELFQRGIFDPLTTQGAWAGEIGMVQMMPEDILMNGVDGDGDGKVSLKTSPPDALHSGANMLRSLGWRANEPWMQEVELPKNFDWSLTGLGTENSGKEWQKLGVRSRESALYGPNLRASILLPQGRFGPAFMVYPNFHVLFEWNKSFVYVTTAAYFATLLEGADRYKNTSPEDGLSASEMKTIQIKLTARGYDVGAIDGILGAKTRAAVQNIQQKLGMAADAWPNMALLNAL